MKIVLLFLLISIHLLEGNELVDFEDFAQDFVLETKRIVIPGFEEAFNPSIIRVNDSILMSFRYIPDRKHTFTSCFGLVWLDEEFNLISEPQILNIREPHERAPPRADDSRLLLIGDTLYFIYSDNADAKISRAGFRVYVAELHEEQGQFVLKNKECLTEFEGESPHLREKNWVPFEYENQLLLAYSINPHTIFYPLLGTSTCATIASTQKTIEWLWGPIRGGTQAFLMNDQYLSFFHSWTNLASLHSEGKIVSHYFMGAYTFSREPPFELTQISPFPIVGKNFYHGQQYTPYWKPIHCVFPTGYIYDEHFIWVAYGRQDHEVWVVKLNKQKLLNSLIPVYN